MDLKTYQPKGDKKNSDFFYEYLPKIYQRRKETGLDELIGDMLAVMIQVNLGDLLNYLSELYLMTPYRILKSYKNETHRTILLKNHRNKSPYLLVMEPLSKTYVDNFTRCNLLFPNSLEKPNTRYIGEIFYCKNLVETKKILESQQFLFINETQSTNSFFYQKDLILTQASDITWNCVGYTHLNWSNILDLQFGSPFEWSLKELQQLKAIEDFVSSTQIPDLLNGIDHLATRVFSHERENAILEFLCLSNYYFWGAYNIGEMNSSTNVTRVQHGKDILSPAKVFTANNTPFMVNSFENLPMPTEQFVKNYGKRLHHMAYEVKDGDHPSGVKNIDYVVQTMHQHGVKFLSKIFGECTHIPDLKQIFSKHSSYSLLITEYVERCMHFDGFFTKKNVAGLTQAAGEDEVISHHIEHHGLIGD